MFIRYSVRALNRARLKRFRKVAFLREKPEAYLIKVGSSKCIRVECRQDVFLNNAARVSRDIRNGERSRAHRFALERREREFFCGNVSPEASGRNAKSRVLKERRITF